MVYALGSDPLVSSRLDAPALAWDAPRLRISYAVDGAVPDVDYVLEASSDLSLWTPVDAAPVSMVDGKQTRTVEEPAAGLSYRFYRLRVRLKP